VEIRRSLRLSIFETPSWPILRDFAIFGCNLARPAQFLQRHFLGNELGGASLDFPALRSGSFVHDIVHVPRHGYFLPLCLSRAR
jgi:hypothetical protein